MLDTLLGTFFPATHDWSVRRSKDSPVWRIALQRCQQESPCRFMWRASDAANVAGSVHDMNPG